eukprot:507282-Rhodomonas_salina.1
MAWSRRTALAGVVLAAAALALVLISQDTDRLLLESGEKGATELRSIQVGSVTSCLSILWLSAVAEWPSGEMWSAFAIG